MKWFWDVSIKWGQFFASIILPTLLAICLMVGAVYTVILPTFKENFIDGKKETLKELTLAAWSVVNYYHGEEEAGRLTVSDAQKLAIETIESIRYGEGLRDYFWITDNTPSLLMHPYSTELLGVDLTDFQDVSGKRIFMEIKRTVAEQKSGFIDYSWNKKYLEDRVVPKLSYVKLFEPWQWVVGTGVFLDDVQQKTQMISQKLARLSLIAVIFLSIILIFVSRQSFTIEKRRNSVEKELVKSRLKYKNLVEKASAPLLMFFDNHCIYSNTAIQQLLDYTEEELSQKSIDHILKYSDDAKDKENLLTGVPFNTHLIASSGEVIESVVTATKTTHDDKEALVLTIRDIRGARLVEKQLDETQERYNRLTNQLNIGIFRVSAERRFQFIEANPAAIRLLDLHDEYQKTGLRDALRKSRVYTELWDIILRDGSITNKKLYLHGETHSLFISLSMIFTKNAEGEILYCEGKIEDISDEKKRETEREQLIVDLQTSLLFLNQPIKHVIGEYLVCGEETTVAEGALKMKSGRTSSLLIHGEFGETLGIVTDLALREKVVAERLDYATPIKNIMSSPVITIDDNAPIFEAVTLMAEKDVKHLVVQNGAGDISSVISNEDLLNVHRYSSSYMISEVEDAQNIEEIIECHERVPRIIKSLIDSGAHAQNITRIITSISDAIFLKLIEFGIREMGEPPARFAFLSLGSEGRGEQTLATDQDNALIFEDVPDARYDEVMGYFLILSEKVCGWLDQAGYSFCKGEVMAMNPKWCQPLSVWKEYFSDWIKDAKPQDLMEVSIFFDFRCMYGEHYFVDQMHSHIIKQVANRDAFFFQLAQNALLFKLPVDFFGNIAADSGGEHPGTFNIKHAIALIVGYARIYAINFGLKETNTLQRLELLCSRGFISEKYYEEIREAYNYLMQVRFKHQVRMIDDDQLPDNHIPLDELNYMEKSVLKKIFSEVGSLQNKLNNIGRVDIFF